MPAAVIAVGALTIGGVTVAAIAQTVLISVAIGAATSLVSSVIAQTLTDNEASGGIGGPTVRQINAPEVRGSVKQATPPVRVIFGEARVGGAVYFYEKDPPYLYLGLMHSALPISEYVSLYVGDNLVLLDANGEPISAPYLVGGTPRLVASTQMGLDSDPINPIIDTDFVSLPNDFKLPGVANTVFKFDYGADFAEFESLWGQVQIPRVEWVVKGCPVPDPRQTTHIIDFDPRDPTELYAAIASWSYSNNAALIQAFWAAMPFGLNAGFSRIRWDEVAAAADFDDERVALKGGGSQARHTIDGVVTLDQKPLTVMEAMLTANRGFVSPSRGGVSVSSSQPRDPVATITDDDVIGGFRFRDDQPKRDLANVASCTFVAPDRSYQDATGPVLRDAGLITADGEELELNVRLPFTTTHQRAQRVLKGFRDETRVGRQVAGVFSLRLLGVTEGLVVRVESAIWPAADGLYQVEEWSLGDGFAGVGLVLSEYDQAIARDWIAADDEQDFVLEVTEAT